MPPLCPPALPAKIGSCGLPDQRQHCGVGRGRAALCGLCGAGVRAGGQDVLCCAVPCRAVLCCAVLCCAVLCCAVLCCAVLCCAVLCLGGYIVIRGLAMLWLPVWYVWYWWLAGSLKESDIRGHILGVGE